MQCTNRAFSYREVNFYFGGGDYHLGVCDICAWYYEEGHRKLFIQ
jgi:hypothetical protein